MAPWGEHMRQALGSGAAKAQRLYWMSDATPHEPVPLKEDTHRQYFRLVTSSVFVWYSKHFETFHGEAFGEARSQHYKDDTDQFEDFPLVAERK